MIFDDAVVNNSHRSRAVRVGVLFTGSPVGGPTGVANAHLTWEDAPPDGLGEVV